MSVTDVAALKASCWLVTGKSSAPATVWWRWRNVSVTDVITYGTACELSALMIIWLITAEPRNRDPPTRRVWAVESGDFENDQITRDCLSQMLAFNPIESYVYEVAIIDETRFEAVAQSPVIFY
jgi:hypothetical protein